MSESGQSRHPDHAPVTSGLPLRADILEPVGMSQRVPTPDSCTELRPHWITSSARLRHAREGCGGVLSVSPNYEASVPSLASRLDCCRTRREQAVAALPRNEMNPFVACALPSEDHACGMESLAAWWLVARDCSFRYLSAGRATPGFPSPPAGARSAGWDKLEHCC